LDNAQQVWSWLTTRGGIGIWGCLDLAQAGKTWTCPINDAEGNPTRKQHWSMTNEPIRVITDPADVVVDVPLEVRRFHVAIRRGSQGFSYKLTDASSRRLEQAVAKAAENRADHESWYEFDYSTQEAVIYVAGKTMPIADYIASLSSGPKTEEVARG